MKFKYVVKNVAWAAGKTATFMPKPTFGDKSSGMHCHQSLWVVGEPLFFDETGYAELSDVARYYIGGILAHAVAAGVHQPDRELLPPAGTRVRGASQSGLLPAKPLDLHPDADHQRQPAGEAD